MAAKRKARFSMRPELTAGPLSRRRRWCLAVFFVLGITAVGRADEPPLTGAAKKEPAKVSGTKTDTAKAATDSATADAAAQQAIARQFAEQIRPLLARYCLACHAMDKPKGDLRLDRLAADFSAESTRARWQEVRRRVLAGEMPPE